MWKTIHGAVQGRSHMREGTPGQDRTYSCVSDDVTCIALADGAGSEPLSHVGAERAVQVGGAYLCAHFAEFCQPAADLKALGQQLVDFVCQQLVQAAREVGVEDIRSLSSTLLLVAVKDEQLVSVHIGDGVVAAVRAGETEVLSAPKNGEYLNVTYFTTSKNVQEGMDIYCGPVENIEALVLMSDGSGDNFYDRRQRKVVPILAEIVQKLSRMNDSQAEMQLQGLLKYIAEQNTQDDCSLALLIRK